MAYNKLLSSEVQLQTSENQLSLAETKIGDLETKLKEHEKRFSIIFPILLNFKQSSSGGHVSSVIPGTTLLDLQTNLAALTKQVHSLQFSLSGPSNIDGLDASLQNVQGQLKLLQHRIVGGGVKIGTKVFSIVRGRTIVGKDGTSYSTLWTVC